MEALPHFPTSRGPDPSSRQWRAEGKALGPPAIGSRSLQAVTWDVPEMLFTLVSPFWGDEVG